MNTAPLPVKLPCSAPFQEVCAALENLVREGVPVVLTGLDGLEPAEADRLLEFFLHDPAVTRPIEPFARLLADLMHQRQTGLWELFPEAPQDAFLRTLPREQPDCLACACFPHCQGYGAWAGSCATWRSLLTSLAEAARELGRLRPRQPRRSNQRSHHVDV